MGSAVNDFEVISADIDVRERLKIQDWFNLFSRYFGFGENIPDALIDIVIGGSFWKGEVRAPVIKVA